ELDRWQAAPIWLDARRCTVGMKSLPYDGGTFADTSITEGGRKLLARQLQALSEAQILALFGSAHVDEFHWGAGSGADARAWTAAFRGRVRQIAEAGPCPSGVTYTRRLVEKTAEKH